MVIFTAPRQTVLKKKKKKKRQGGAKKARLTLSRFKSAILDNKLRYAPTTPYKIFVRKYWYWWRRTVTNRFSKPILSIQTVNKRLEEIEIER